MLIIPILSKLKKYIKFCVISPAWFKLKTLLELTSELFVFSRPGRLICFEVWLIILDNISGLSVV